MKKNGTAELKEAKRDHPHPPKERRHKFIPFRGVSLNDHVIGYEHMGGRGGNNLTLVDRVLNEGLNGVVAFTVIG